MVVGCWSLVVGCWLLVVGKLRIQGRMQIFEKMFQGGLNHDPRPEFETRGKMLQIPLKNTELGAFCVENGYLRIQGRMQIFEKKKSQKALNHVMTG